MDSSRPPAIPSRRPNHALAASGYVITGNKYQREDDLPALPGVLGLEIVRHYNSAYSKPGNRNGAIGRGWRLSYETELFDTRGMIQIMQADGGRVIFHRAPKHPGLCSITNPANGSMQLDRKPTGLFECPWTKSDEQAKERDMTQPSTTTTEINCSVILFYEKNKTIMNVRIWRCIASSILSAALYSMPARADWDYSLAAKMAIHDALFSTCGKIEPRLNAVLGEDWSRLVLLNGMKAIRSARKSPEYFHVYRGVLYDQLKIGWGDAEEEAHECERIFFMLNNGESKQNQWWRDRFCVDVPLNSVEGSGEGQRCGAGPGAQVSFENTVRDANISILRLAPSSDVSFPRAGIFPLWRDLRYRIVSNNSAGHAYAIPESVEFEWKEWPRTFPGKPKNDRDLESFRLYVDEVRGKVQRKRAQLVVRGRIPNEAIAEALQAEQAEQAAKFGQPVAVSLRLYFIFMQDGLRFRWEQWHGECIKRYGGDEIDLPRSQFLSGDWVCGEPEPKPCSYETTKN